MSRREAWAGAAAAAAAATQLTQLLAEEPAEGEAESARAHPPARGSRIS